LESLVGVVVGFLLSQLAGLMRETATKKKVRRSIRTLLALELDQNLNLLKDYWHDVSLPADEDEPDENPTDRLVRRSREVPYPPLQAIAWQAHIDRTSEVLNENELKQVWQQYEIIQFLPTLHSRLSESRPDETAKGYGYLRASRALRTQGITAATFTSEPAALMMEYKTLISETIKTGNPLDSGK